MRRALGPTCRLYSTPSASNTTHLLSILQRNSELTATDAQNELRWLRQASNGVEPARRDGALEILVQRRGAGEPLQYILGMSVS